MKFSACFFLIIGTLSLSAQEYNFSASTNAYQSISNGTEIEKETFFTMPFNFSLYGEQMDSFYIGSTPDIAATSALVSSFEISLSRHTGYVSKCEYLVEGNEGERIMKLQYSGIKFLSDTTKKDSMEAQIWLFEGTNKIELHYGPVKIDNFKSYEYNHATEEWIKGISCGILTTEYDHDYVLKGTPKSPQISGTFDFWATLNGHPASGQVYRFTPKPSSIDVPFHGPVNCYPNPAVDKLIIELSTEAINNTIQGNIAIYTEDGKKCMQNRIHNSGQPTIINVAHLPKGAYIIVGQMGNEYFSKSIMID